MNNRFLFYIPCPLGTEEDLVQELQEFWPFLIEKDGRLHSEALEVLEVNPGGVLIQNSLGLGLQINDFSKIAHRVLLRIAEFRVRDFPKLYQKFKKINFSPWLDSLNFTIEVSASGSRLNNEKRIIEVAKEVWGSRLSKSAEPSNKRTESSNKKGDAPIQNTEQPQKVYIRMHQDLCTLSLDTTGDHLHLRGYRKKQGLAPLRETLAAWALRKMSEETCANELKNKILVDPMAGTGTFLWEASHLFRPFFLRDYSFQKWKGIPKNLLSRQRKSLYPLDPPPAFYSLWAFDKDPKMHELFEEQRKLIQSDKEDPVSFPLFFETQDIWNPIPFNKEKFFEGKDCWLITNPPYGERLKELRPFIESLLQMIKIFQAKKIAFFLIEKQQKELKLSSQLLRSYSWEKAIPISNGGLKVFLNIFSDLK